MSNTRVINKLKETKTSFNDNAYLYIILKRGEGVSSMILSVSSNVTFLQEDHMRD